MSGGNFNMSDTLSALLCCSLLAVMFFASGGQSLAGQEIEILQPVPPPGPQPVPGPGQPEKQIEPDKPEFKIPPAAEIPGEMHAEFSDQGNLPLTMLDQQLELETRFGKLTIPIAEIRKLELATRVAPELREKITAALDALGSENFAKREAATKELLGYREAAYPQLVQLSRASDQEVARRTLELVEKLRESLPAERLHARTADLVTTSDSIIAGTLTASKLKVRTKQFGEQELRLADLRSLSARPREESDPLPKQILPDPGSLTQFTQQVGKSFHFGVTGNNNGTVWGTGVFTTDTSLASAAVHAGALKLGEAGVVKVTIVPSPPQFNGSLQNGINSHSYPQYTAAFKIAKVRVAKQGATP